MSVVGFDFGCQTTVICQAKRGAIETSLNEASKRKTPNVVSFQSEQRFIGEAGQSLARGKVKEED